jgi:hypothetical protein
MNDTSKIIPSSLHVYKQNLEKALTAFLVGRRKLGPQEAVYVCGAILPYVLEGFWCKVAAGFTGALTFSYEETIDVASKNLDPQSKKIFANFRDLIISALQDLEKWGFYDQLHEYFFASLQKNSSKNYGAILEDEFKELSDEMKKETMMREEKGLTQELVLSVFNEFKGRFKNMSDEQLIDTFNRELGNSEWVSLRELFQLALRDEFKNRGYDYSAIDAGESLSFKKKIKLVGKKVVAQPKLFGIFG